MAARDINGAALVPGLNVDRVDIEAGLARMVQLGFNDGNHRMEVEYNLTRWARGEEGSADKSMSRSLSGVDYTSWRIILATAIATAETAANEPAPSEWPVADDGLLTPHQRFESKNHRIEKARTLEHFRVLVATTGEYTVEEARTSADSIPLSQVIGLLDQQIGAIRAGEPGFMVDWLTPEDIEARRHESALGRPEEAGPEDSEAVRPRWNIRRLLQIVWPYVDSAGTNETKEDRR